MWKNYYLGKLDNKCTSVYGCFISESVDTCFQCGPNYCLTNGLCNYTSIVPDNKEDICYKCLKTNDNGIGWNICFEGYSLTDKCLYINMDSCKEKENNECLISADVSSRMVG